MHGLPRCHKDAEHGRRDVRNREHHEHSSNLRRPYGWRILVGETRASHQEHPAKTILGNFIYLPGHYQASYRKCDFPGVARERFGIDR
jgi:hypothetical protein